MKEYYKYIGLLLLGILASSANICSAQDMNLYILTKNKVIPLYENELCQKEVFTIFEDSIFQNSYQLQLLDTADIAYQVRITNYTSIIGWIEKKNVCISCTNQEIKSQMRSSKRALPNITLSTQEQMRDKSNGYYCFIPHDNKIIPLYENASCKKALYTIFQDSIFERWYEMEILESSNLAYKVKLYSVTLFNSPIIEGWIEKKNCGVYLDEGRTIKLYSLPTNDATFMPIQLSKMTTAIVFDVHFENKFLFVKFVDEKTNILYEGWVEHYCDSLYDSCN